MTATPGQPADEIPEAFARYQLATFPVDLDDFARNETAMRWKHLTSPAERKFWAELDAELGQLREQERLARERRDEVERRMLALAARLEDEAAASNYALEADAKAEAAEGIRKGLDV